jgi:hypothetical protein
MVERRRLEGSPPAVDRPLWRGRPRKDVIIRPGDPRFAIERDAWTAAARKAQSLHSADELLAGVADHDWHVRYESIDRLKARWTTTTERSRPWPSSRSAVRLGTFAGRL